MPLQASSEVSKRREALEELLRSDGWAYLRAYVLKEWQGSGYQNRMSTALGANDIVEPKSVHKTALEMMRLIEWPTIEVRNLKGSLDDE